MKNSFFIKKTARQDIFEQTPSIEKFYNYFLYTTQLLNRPI